ncbi:hypothetical protein BDV93DRAFT_557963 [Ceratobasidium sp. AG-I]|nr:hypothetical protein BDV93DRAFT_557963 [Ceratobasidium sp. AG-I]
MSSSKNGPSLAQDRPRRQNVPVPARAQQHVDTTVKLRTSRNESATQKSTQAEIDARPKPLQDDDSFIFGAPLPPPSASSSDAQRKHALAQIYLQKIALRNGEDHRADFESGKIGLEELIEMDADHEANKLPSSNQPSNKQTTSSGQDKGKGRGNETLPESQVATNYHGITMGDTSYSVQSKYANNAPPPSLKTAKQNTIHTTTPAQSLPSLTRTDATTIYPGKESGYPMTPLTAPRRPTNSQPQPTNQTPTDAYARNQGGPIHQPRKSGQHSIVAPGPASHMSTPVNARLPVNTTSRPSDQTGPHRQPREPKQAMTNPPGPPNTTSTKANAQASARDPARNVPQTTQPTLRPVQQPQGHRPHRPQERQHHASSNQQPDGRLVHDRTQVQANPSNGGGVKRRSTNHTDSRYMPISMGSRQSVRSKAKPAHASASTRHATHRPRPAARQSTPAEEDAPNYDGPDAGVDANADDDIDAVANAANDPIVAPMSQTKTKQTAQKQQSTIKGHDLNTQDTVKVMIEAALAQIIANGTYECPPSDAGAEQPSREDIVAEAWGLACAKTRTDYPLLPSHIKVIDSQVTTSRSRAKQALKPFVDKYFGFDDDTPEKNAVLSKKNLLDKFHQADPDNDRMWFQSEFLRRACRVVAFYGDGSLAAKYPKAFYPLPKTYIAFVCTITQHILYCYREGPFAKDNLHVPMQLSVYRRYLRKLTELENNQRNTYSRVIGEINDYCRASISSSATTVHDGSPGPMREWSPDKEEPYVCKYQDPPSDEPRCQHDYDNDDMGAQSAGEGYDQDMAGPSNHRNAYKIEEDQDEPTDNEMDEIDLEEKPNGSGDDDEYLTE